MTTMSYMAIPGVALKLYPQPAMQTINHEIVFDRLCWYFKLMPEEVLGGDRHYPLKLKRQVMQFLVRRYSMLNVVETGKLFNRDHTTILHSVKKVEELFHIQDQHLLDMLAEAEYYLLSNVTA